MRQLADHDRHHRWRGRLGQAGEERCADVVLDQDSLVVEMLEQQTGTQGIQDVGQGGQVVAAAQVAGEGKVRLLRRWSFHHVFQLGRRQLISGYPGGDTALP